MIALLFLTVAGILFFGYSAIGFWKTDSKELALVFALAAIGCPVCAYSLVTGLSQLSQAMEQESKK